MKNEDLLWVYITSGALDCVLIACVIVLFIIIIFNNRKDSHEFYRVAIMIYIITAYALRITLFIFMSAKYPDAPFNRDHSHLFKNSDEFIRDFLIRLAVLLHPLAGFAYLCRWLGYYWWTKAKQSLMDTNVKKFRKYLKIAFISISVLSVVFCLLQCIYKDELIIAFTIYLVILYSAVPISILVCISLFLIKLKENNCQLFYEKKKGVWYYCIVICLLMFFRAASITIDLIVQQHKEKGRHTIYSVDDYINIIFFYVELIPSVILVFALYKSYREGVDLRRSKELFIKKEIDQMMTFQSEQKAPSDSDDSKYMKFFKNNISESLGYYKLSTGHSPAPGTHGNNTNSNRFTSQEFLDMSETLAYY